MTPTREELLALAERVEALSERDRAKLAALDAEPDLEAWRPALEAFQESRGNLPPSTPFDDFDFNVIRALQAALPLAPAPSPMGEREIAELARELRVQYENTLYSTEEAIALVIRETLRRVPAWPGEEELREMARAIAREGFLGASYHVKDAALEMARRLKERMGAGSGAECDICNGLNTSCPEGCERDPKTGELLLGEQPWIKWHGGECPVLAETRVEYKLRNGAVRTAKAWQLVWRHCANLSAYDIVAYRIIPGEEA